jgi:hypothetical protein
MVDGERNTWAIFAECIKDLRKAYVARFTRPTMEFHQQVEEDSKAIYSKLSVLTVDYPSTDEFYLRSPGVKKSQRDPFRLVSKVRAFLW